MLPKTLVLPEIKQSFTARLAVKKETSFEELPKIEELYPSLSKVLDEFVPHKLPLYLLGPDLKMKKKLSKCVIELTKVDAYKSIQMGFGGMVSIRFKVPMDHVIGYGMYGVEDAVFFSYGGLTFKIVERYFGKNLAENCFDVAFNGVVQDGV